MLILCPSGKDGNTDKGIMRLSEIFFDCNAKVKRSYPEMSVKKTFGVAMIILISYLLNARDICSYIICIS